MPAFKATVVGENFEFVIDNETQLLDFSRTLYVDADNETAAQQAALARVREELLNQSLMDNEGGQLISIDELCQAEGQVDQELLGDFVWCFPDDDTADEC